jgi:hypothetical protein
VGDVAKLRVIEGGEVVEDLSAIPRDVLEARLLRIESQNAHLTRELRLAEDEHATDRARIAGLKGQISKWNRQATPDDLVEPILQRWKQACRGPRSSCEIPLDGKRADLVRKTIKRLADADPDPELANPDKDKRAAAVQTAQQRASAAVLEAIEGAAAFPYREKYGKRWPEGGKGRYKANDIPDILKDELTLEKFRHLHDGDEKRRAYAHDLKRRIDTSPQFKLWLASLDPQYGELIARAVRWCQANP